MTALYTREMALQYQSIDPVEINGWWAHFLDAKTQSILEIGAGTGRDARWMRSQCPQADITLVEPASVFSEFLPRGDGWRVVKDSLPDLNKIIGSNCHYDVVLMNAVFMHVAPRQRQRVFRKLTAVTRPGGCLVIQTKLNHPEPERGQYEVEAGDIVRLAVEHGWVVAHESQSHDVEGRGIVWGRYVLRLPDDATGTLPLLRRIVVSDNKSSSYKLGLLRVLCKVASEVPGCAQIIGDNVVLPAGIVGLYWLRAYIPLINANVPQSPTNRHSTQKLAFAGGSAFAAVQTLPPASLLLGSPVQPDLQIPMSVALSQAVSNIKGQPVNYIRLDESQLFTLNTGRRPASIPELSPKHLQGFGDFIVPLAIWRALRTHEVWIEPTILSNWQRLSTGWLRNQNRMDVLAGDIAQAFMWPDLSTRDTSLVSDRVKQLNGASCVWTAAKVSDKNLNVDHALPFAHWPCNQMWNLLPTTKSVNQSKSDRIPTAGLLDESRIRITDWWSRAFLDEEHWNERFWVEANAGLPALAGSRDPDDLFEALCMQAERLRSDYRLRSWRP